MEQKRDLWDITSDIETVLADLRNTREFQASYSAIFDRVNKKDREKIHDHDTAAIMERILFDRLYNEVTALTKLGEELNAAVVQNMIEKEAAEKQDVSKHGKIFTAADMVRGKATA